VETPSFFNGGRSQLFGVLHEPEGTALPCAFVLSHPFGEEKLWSHRVFVSLARSLSNLGYPVLRFDYMGAGDSEGTLRDSSIDSHVADLSAAVAHLRARIGTHISIGVIGLRFGATVAALHHESEMARGANPGPLILWDPVVDGEAYVQDLLRSHLGTQLAVLGRVVEGREVLRERIRRGESVNLDGYEFASGLHDSCAQTPLIPMTPKQFGGDCLVIQISPRADAKPRADLEELARSYRQGEFRMCVEEPFWKEIRAFYGRAVNLDTDTMKWLEDHRANG
jgi:exosortase A-associated hydrolase 2